jgi:hypothetical protein
MEKPYKFSILDLKTNEWNCQDREPLLHELQTWEPTSENVSKLEQTKECYIDTRYEAKLRLFRYWQKKSGIIEKRYNPFEGTEIGKSIPILNF